MPDGRNLVVNDNKGGVHLVDRQTLKVNLLLSTGPGGYHRLVVHPTKPWIYFENLGKTVKIDINTGDRTEFKANFPMAFMQKGQQIVNCDGIFDSVSGKTIQRFKKPEQTYEVEAISCSPDEKYIAFSSREVTSHPVHTTPGMHSPGPSETRIHRTLDFALVGAIDTSAVSDKYLFWLGSRQLQIWEPGDVYEIPSGKLLRKQSRTKTVGVDLPLVEDTVKVRTADRDEILKIRYPEMNLSIHDFSFPKSGGLAITAMPVAQSRGWGFSIGGYPSYFMILKDGAMANLGSSKDNIDQMELADVVPGLIFSGNRGQITKNGLVVHSIEFNLHGGPKPWTLESQIYGSTSSGSPVVSRFASGQDILRKLRPPDDMMTIPQLARKTSKYLVDIDLYRWPLMTCYRLGDKQKVWNLPQGKRMPDHPMFDLSESLVAYNESIIKGDKLTFDLVIRRLETGAEIRRLPCQDGFECVISHDEKTLAMRNGNWISTLDLTNPNSGFRRLVDYNDSPYFDSANDWSPHLKWTPNDQYLVASTTLQPLKFIDVATGMTACEMSLFSGNRLVALCPDGTKGDGGKSERLARVWRNNQWVGVESKTSFFLDLLK